MTIDAGAVAARLADVRARLAAARGEHVDVLAVTKGFGDDAVAAAAAAGCRAVGENYAQELVAKSDALAAAGVAVHFIGRLQSNKVRVVAALVDLWESIDRPSLVDELVRRAPGAHLLVQVDGTGEAAGRGKSGCRPSDVEGLVAGATAAGLVVDGLMTVGPTEGGPEAARPAFRLVRRLANDLGLAVVSMGMTDDLEVAVEEGSTQIRVGTALFGPRPR